MSLVEPSNPIRLLHPKLTVIITACGADGKCNAMTAAWAMPVSHNPPLIAVSISPERYTHKLISETKMFAVNVPDIKLFEKVRFFGIVSGRDKDKLKISGLKIRKSSRLGLPLIEDCVAWLECEVENSIRTGDHTLFIGRIVGSAVKKEFFVGVDVFDAKVFKPIMHLGGPHYTTTTSYEIY